MAFRIQFVSVGRARFEYRDTDMLCALQVGSLVHFHGI